MTIESPATYINQLNASYPEGTADRSTADDHLRLIKSTIKASFPNITGAMTATQAELNLMVGNTETLSRILSQLSLSVSAINTAMANWSSTVAVIAQSLSVEISRVTSLSACLTTANTELARVGSLVGSPSHSVFPNGGLSNLVLVAMGYADVNSYSADPYVSISTSVVSGYNIASITCYASANTGLITLTKPFSTSTGAVVLHRVTLRRGPTIADSTLVELAAGSASSSQITFYYPSGAALAAMSMTYATINVFSYMAKTAVKP